MTEQEKLDYMSRNFVLLNEGGKDYLAQVSQQLLFIQHPAVPPLPVQQREYKARRLCEALVSGGATSLIC